MSVAKTLLVSLLLCGATPAFASCQIHVDPLPMSSKCAPAEVMKFLNQEFTCHHFAGEEPYDAERAEYIRKQVKISQCDQLACIRQDMLTKYVKEKFTPSLQSILTQHIHESSDWKNEPCNRKK